MNEIIVLSGKGGTGKTSLVAAILAYLDEVIVADCDVDAPDLHLLLRGGTCSDQAFYGLEKPNLNMDLCIGCLECVDKCKFGCDIVNNSSLDSCEGCGVCAYICPSNAIEMKKVKVGQLIHRKIDKGDFIFGRLIPGEETSGKLVAAVRRKANEIAELQGRSTIIVDGAPGIACNVISSVTGANHVVIVTEPSLSGLHDLKRVHELIEKFHIKVTVVINKVDLSKQGAESIRHYCSEKKLSVALEIPFYKGIVDSINNGILPPTMNETFYEKIKFKSFLHEIDCLKI